MQEMKNIPYADYYHKRKDKPYTDTDYWPTRWVSVNDGLRPPFVAAYRKAFHMDKDDVVRVYVSADERYELFVDDVRIGRGSERGDKNNWFYETYDLHLAAGKHMIVARVWSLGSLKPWAQQSVYHGFILSPDKEEYIKLFGTGVAKWQAKILDGYSFIPPADTVGYGGGMGSMFSIDGARFPWGFESGTGEGWTEAEALHSGNNGIVRNPTRNVHKMRPAMLPPMLEGKIHAGNVRYVAKPTMRDVRFEPFTGTSHIHGELDAWQKFVRGEKLIFPADQSRRVIIDLENYFCAYPALLVSGGKGGRITVSWAESLFMDSDLSNIQQKGNRNELEGKYFRGMSDTFVLDGGAARKYEPLWWRAGRYVELLIISGNEPIKIEGLQLYETRYPLSMESWFRASDARMENLIPAAVRTLQMCSHETYMDCPFYEQLMYIGDTRVEALTTYVISKDSRLPQKALCLFDAAREGYDGLNACAYPEQYSKIIPSFSLWWVGMVYDYALWRGDKCFIQSLMPGVRAVMETILSNRNESGIIKYPAGWDYIDWTQNPAEKWYYGIAPDEGYDVNSIFNWQTVYILKLLSGLEEFVGEPELAARAKRMAKELARSTTLAFWHEERGMFADDLLKKNFSEHAQCMALLSGETEQPMQEKVFYGLIHANDLAKTSIFYSHYLFEVMKARGRADLFQERMKAWYALENLGYKTLPEYLNEISRSDCHAWSSHPIYHYFTFVLGIKPGSMGFETVEICPNLDNLDWAKGIMVHPKGKITVAYQKEYDHIVAEIELPEGLEGNLRDSKNDVNLKSGKQTIILN